MFIVLCCSCLCPIHWSQVLSREWRCSWSSGDRWCSNYIWVINSFSAYQGVTYIGGLTVHIDDLAQDCSNSSVLAMVLLQSCAKPLIWYWWLSHQYIIMTIVGYRSDYEPTKDTPHLKFLSYPSFSLSILDKNNNVLRRFSFNCE